VRPSEPVKKEPLSSPAESSPLWQSLSKFEVSAGVELDFVKRLAQENGWSVSYSRRVYKEYLKFLYLAATSAHPVTPSDAVDQAWHLHLCYSHSYWNNLCENLIKRDIHHGPTSGGESENIRYHHQYEETLSAYEKNFGIKPPLDIWPPPSIRFGGDEFVRVNKSETWTIDKKASNRRIYLACILAITFLAASWIGLGQSYALALSFAVGVLGFVIIKEWENRHRSSSGGCGTGCGSSGGTTREGPDAESSVEVGGGSDAGCGGGGCGGGGCGS
jgi:hypothetical protein